MIATFLLGHWRALGALVIVLALSAYIETIRIERDHAYAAEATAKAALATFKAQVSALGEKAKIEAQAKEDADKKRKEDADRENSEALAALAGTIKRLRSDPSRGRLPDAAPGSSRPELACYDRAILSRAYGTLVEEVRGSADESSKATVDLNTAKKWALKLKMESVLNSHP